LTLAEGNDALPRQMALVALARMGMGRGEPAGGAAALAAMADAVFAGSDPESARARVSGEALRRAGSASLVLLAGARGGHGADTHPIAEPLPVPDGPLDLEATLGQLVPWDFSEKELASALSQYAEPIKHAALAALQTSSQSALAVLDALSPGDGALEPFVGVSEPASSASPVPPAISAARTKAQQIARALEPSIVTLARHPDASVRTKAVVILARSQSDAATEALVTATSDATEAVQRVALAAIGSQRDPRAVAAVGKVLSSHENWAMRVLAAQAMGRLGAAGDAAEAARALHDAATKDTYALVREAALQAFATFDPRGAQDLAVSMSRTDPEPRIRDTARSLGHVSP
jgi:cellulose synthase operon protein C